MKDVNGILYPESDIMYVSPIFEATYCFWFDVTIRRYRLGWFNRLVPYMMAVSVKSDTIPCKANKQVLKKIKTDLENKRNKFL